MGQTGGGVCREGLAGLEATGVWIGYCAEEIRETCLVWLRKQGRGHLKTTQPVTLESDMKSV